MNTQLRAWCIGVLEAATLLAVTSVPLFVNFYGFRVFELGKGALVVALALLAALAGLVALIEGRFHGVRASLRQPVVIAAALLWAATAIATAFSVVPRTSLLGSSERAAGLVALTAALVLFATAAAVARAPDRRRRIVAALIGGSVPVAAFALTQALGLEVVPGEVESAARVFGTLSNPIFLGAYLMLALPLTLARVMAALRRGAVGVAVGLGLVGLLQLVALLASASRGPLLGLAAGLFVFAVAWAAASGRRSVGWAAVGLAVAGALFLVVLNTPGGPLAPFADAPILGRLAQISDTTGGSQAARLRIWAAVSELLAEQPAARHVTGHGPEALKYAVLPYAGPNIGGRAQADRLVDRAHNVLLDQWVMTGAPGALARVLVLGAWLFTASAVVGLADTSRERRMLAGLLALGTVLGAATWLVPSLRVYAGALTLLGLLAGLVIYLLAALALRDRPGTVDLLGVGLLAAGAAATAEAALGIETTVTALVFWVLAGLVVALATAPDAGDETGEPTAAERREAPAPSEPGTVTLGWSPGGAALGLAFGGALGLLLYGFLLQGAPRLPDTLPVLALLLGAGWLGGLLAAGDARESMTAAALVAPVTVLVYGLLRVGTLAATGDAATLFAVTIVWLLVLALLGGVWLRDRLTRAPIASGPVVIAYPLLAVFAVAALLTLSIRPVQADIYFQSAVASFDAGLQTDDPALVEAAEVLFARAVADNPYEDVYPLKWAEYYTLVGTMSPDAETAAVWFQRAQGYVDRAKTLDPLMPYHDFNHGHLQLLFAQMVDPEQRARFAADAEYNLQRAFDRVPSDPQVANELAMAKLLQGEGAESVALLEYVRDHLDPENPTTWSLLGRAYSVVGRDADAEAAVSRSIELGGGAPEDLVSLGDLARQNGDLPGAVRWYEQAVQAGATSWAVLFNLGLLYRDVGDADKALEALSAARQLAPTPEDAARIEEAIQTVLEGESGLP